MAYSEQVKAAQLALNGWWEVTPKLVPDGYWGPQTQRGVQQFQKRAGLRITGQLDADTLQRLGVANAGLNVVAGGSVDIGNTGVGAGAAAAAAIFGVPPSALVSFVDATGRAFALPAGASVTLRDINGTIHSVAASVAGATNIFGRGVVLGATSGGTDVLQAALDAGKDTVKKAASEFTWSTLLTFGLIAVVVATVLRR